MSIYTEIVGKTELEASLIEVLEVDFNINKRYATSLTQNNVRPHINKLIDNITCVIESPYIDKVYRDSFYTYYSSKLSHYKRDCIRVAFFEGEIQDTQFRQKESLNTLQSSFRGFIIIRPTDPQIIGRSVIDPRVHKENNFLTCSTLLSCTVNSVKLTVNGFPHSSQDTETISCAETTLWAVMEYFGSKYPEYKPVLPSRIIDVLKQVSFERQVPSKGLNVQQIAFALKEFGFGTRIYSKAEFKELEFKRLLSTYIESGIPLVVALDNRRRGGNIGHAILAVGHERVDDQMIDILGQSVESDGYVKNKIDTKNISFYDNDDINKQFVFIDDNRPAYQKAFLETPALHYSQANWQACELTYFVAPLYPKIYLEAYEAKSFCKNAFFELFPDISDGIEIFIRFFLTSGRSFKHSTALNDSIDDDFKSIILGTSLPKFVWVCEFSTRELIKEQKANGLMLIDATEANTKGIKPLIFASFQGLTYSEDPSTGILSRIYLNLAPFSIFINNLKGF